MLGKSLLLHDDEQGAPTHVLCFLSQEDPTILLKCDPWLADGTFSSCLKLVYQICTIHGQVNTHTDSFVFFFLPNKREEIYIHTVKNEFLILVLKTQESNPGPQGMLFTNQDRQRLSNLLSCRLELVAPTARQLSERYSPNEDQITAECAPSNVQTYTETAACQKKFKTRPDTGPANEHQLLPVSSPELATQLAGSGDAVNKSSRTKHCHLFARAAPTRIPCPQNTAPRSTPCQCLVCKPEPCKN
ncbi:hypothetical protein DSO57_1014473 [Entomophthora muscae]|uniref:Uncharacterized protein n=1 Tax=Entomophthora muscae TaxID=34485 RepID=A0ACC2TSZ2_9FUNG|nr:hypothetical protein DSO57_1014473 [Entomophthora muscae]